MREYSLLEAAPNNEDPSSAGAADAAAFYLLISSPLHNHFLLSTHAHSVSISDSYITEVALFSHDASAAVALKLRSDL